MYKHAPADYPCSFCNRIKRIEDEYAVQDDIVLQNAAITAFISPKWWVNNPGHVIIISNTHFENIYELPLEIATKVQETRMSGIIICMYFHGLKMITCIKIIVTNALYQKKNDCRMQKS